MSTETLSTASQHGQSLFGINTTNRGKIVVFGGGVPVKIGDAVSVWWAPAAA